MTISRDIFSQVSPKILSLKTKNQNDMTLVARLTLDDEFAVLLVGILHGVQGLLGDAVEVHVPPVFQHLECDVRAVDHRSRGL